MQRRSYTAEEKAKLVLEMIRGEHEVNKIAVRECVALNLLRKWKCEFPEVVIPLSKPPQRPLYRTINVI